MNFYTHVSVKGSRILYRGYEDGKRVQRSEVYTPTLFIPSRDPKAEWRSLGGKPLEPFKPGDISDCKDFIDQYKGTKGFEIFGNTDWQYQYIGEKHPDGDYDPDAVRIAFIDIETESENGFPDLATANERINAVTVKVGSSVWVHCLNDAAIPHREGMNVLCFGGDEEGMLRSFLDRWAETDPDVVTGWNTMFFDIPYLVRRIERVLGEKEAKRLSPWKDIKRRDVQYGDRVYEVFDLVGIASIDYLELYKKFTYTMRESYSLDHIAKVELDENKLKYDGSLKDFYTNDYSKFILYNIKDVELVERLEGKLKLMELAIALAYSAKVNLGDVFSQVRTWDAIIYHELSSRKIAIPQRKTSEKDDQYEGAYVKDPITGSHDWVVSYDLDSLYPHLIMQYNLSPETKVDSSHRGRFKVSDFLAHGGAGTGACATKDRDDLAKFLSECRERNRCVPANCVLFDKTRQGFLPALMERMYEERRRYKKLMLGAKATLKELPKDAPPEEIRRIKNDIAKYNNFQMVRKIQLNSAYGAIGNQYFRYFDIDIAEAITVSGQLSIEWIEGHLNSFLNGALGSEGKDFIVAADTDSVYIRLGEIVRTVMPEQTDPMAITKRIDGFCKTVVQKFIEEKYADLASQQNAYAQKMSMKREMIASRGIWTAKKRYMLAVRIGEDNVLLKSPEIKTVGLETKRSSHPQVAREMLERCIEEILVGTEERLQSMVAEFGERFYTMPAEVIAYPRGCKGVEKWAHRDMVYKPCTPIAARASLVHNHWIDRLSLGRKYPKIKDGDKIKFVYLKMPNPLKENVVGFVGTVPPEFKVEPDYIDYDTQFSKTFIEPLGNILSFVGWSAVPTSTLDSFFA